MKRVRAPAQGLVEMYRQALKEYLADGGEAPLHQAYELGRQALDSGTGLLGLVNIHQEATASLLREANGDALRRFRDAHHFLLESMAPFEMMQVGNQESNAALRRLNAILEGKLNASPIYCTMKLPSCWPRYTWNSRRSCGKFHPRPSARMWNASPPTWIRCGSSCGSCPMNCVLPSSTSSA